HLPVSPGSALEMIETFGRRLEEKYPETQLITGFAETATAVGAAVASCFPEDRVYVHTTRETVKGVENWVCFREEHSHATEQKLCGNPLENLESLHILFVEDELSTGRTMCNIVSQMRRQFPGLEGKQMTAASLINRMPDLSVLLDKGVACEWLLRIPERDYTEEVMKYAVLEPEDCRGAVPGSFQCCCLDRAIPNPRAGMPIGQYLRECAAAVDAALAQIRNRLHGSVLVLGTEECMYPALKLGQAIEAVIPGPVSVHATTRSPIAVSHSEGYPITNGYCIRSFYEPERDTYIYNLKHYDTVIVLTDAGPETDAGARDLAAACGRHGMQPVILYGGEHV
ncbi:MAG: phosphoribosyltransferase family protein, partial [Oscillospiraceae bacterium]|nr:phosphoribosyltransferase family protein [Oscillospiraceae bacterium]